MKVPCALLLAFFLGSCAAGAARADGPVTGKVLESVDAGSYTYLRLATREGEVWAAIVATPVRKGTRVTLENTMEMRDFQSKTLGRSFDRILFGTLGGAPAGTAAADAYLDVHGQAERKPDEVLVTRINRAAGPDARSVAEVHAGRAQLAGKPVAVRGRVVKVSSGILGRSWVHLRDGSGAAGDGSNDLLVTTRDTVAVGQVVEARGKVRVDVDYGAGYAYKVVVEDAALK